MHRLKIMITLKSHVLINSGQGDENMTATRDYLPGTALIGAFAARFIRSRKLNQAAAHENKDFQKFFLGHDLRFQNAHIVQSVNDTKRSVPAPASLFCHKDEMDKDKRILNNRLSGQPDPGEKNLYKWLFFDNQTVTDIPVRKQIHFHHQQSPDRFKGRSTDEEGMIFNYESMIPGQSFVAEIRGNAETLKDFKNEFDNISEIFIGRSKMTEYGSARLQFISDKPEALPAVTNIQQGKSINVTCLSQVILYNKNGFPDPSARGLENEFNYLLNLKTDQKVEIGSIFSGTETVENYVGIWNMRKFTDIALQAGTCFQLILPDSVTNDDIQKIQNSGIGLRRHEGFGEIRFILPDLDKYQWPKRDNNQADTHKPDIPPPQVVGDIIKNTVKNNVLESAKNRALKDSSGFNLENKSVLARLELLLEKGAGSFHEKIKALDGKKAADTLKKAKFHNISLWDNMTEPLDLDSLSDKKKLKELKALDNNPHYSPFIDQALTELEMDNTLHYTYWQTFIRALRKAGD